MKENKKTKELDPIVVSSKHVSSFVLSPSLRNELGDMDIGKLTLMFLRTQKQD
jgi:hypothetical protein